MGTPYITELFDEINKNPSKMNSDFNGKFAVAEVLRYAFDTRLKWLLPEGMPEIKYDPNPQGMTMTNFYTQVRKLGLFCRGDLNKVRLESLFIQFVEGLHKTEVDLVVAIKDQTLSQKYPNITSELVVSLGLVPQEFVVVQKRKRGKQSERQTA